MTRTRYASAATTDGSLQLAASLMRKAAEILGPWLAQAVLPFLLVLYLGLRGGGYDVIVRSEVGIAAWWIALLGAAVGAFPRSRIPRGAWIALCLFAAFATWTALGIAWSESAEHSLAEVSRVATLLGVFTLALCVQGPLGIERMVGGIAAAITVVCAIALLSRLEPTWFPDLETPEFLPGTRARLHYPLGYWNGLATFAAMGVPLLLVITTSARHILTKALALAAVPLLILTVFFTLSRGGALEIAAGLAVLFALHPKRLSLVIVTFVAGVGGAMLIVGAHQRKALTEGLTNASALSQGDEMLVLLIVVCAGVGLLGAAVGLAARYGMGPQPVITRRQAALVTAMAGIVAVLFLTASNTPERITNAWEDFKEPTPGTGPQRFESISGSGRYQLWKAAVEANHSAPLTGIGPGTFEYYWAEHGTRPGFVRDAHSLYLEVLAESGIVGLVLVLGFLSAPFVIGAIRLWHVAPQRRTAFAGALSGCFAFLVAAAIDWAWELTVLPTVFCLLSASALCAKDKRRRPQPWSGLIPRLALPCASVVALIVIAVPMASTEAIRKSQTHTQANRLNEALDEASIADAIQPWAASPKLQQALILELEGDFPAATKTARAATSDEPKNWRAWLILSRLEAQAGNPAEAIAAFRTARSLNPRSSLFQTE